LKIYEELNNIIIPIRKKIFLIYEQEYSDMKEEVLVDSLLLLKEEVLVDSILLYKE